MYYLDSDICIELMKGRLPYAYELMRKSDPALFAIPAIVEAELRTGAAKSDRPRKNLALLERFLAPFARIPFDSECAATYAVIRSQLESEGRKIGPNDLLIAATALAHGAVLVSNNAREFSRIPTLHLESWAEVELP